jgi:hypothetical protein
MRACIPAILLALACWAVIIAIAAFVLPGPW